MSDTTNPTPERAPHKKCYESLEQAQAIVPPSDKLRIYIAVDPAGREVYTWASSVEGAVINLARQDGFTARVAEPKSGVITKERLAGKLAELTDEELAELGLSRKKSRK